MKSRTVVLFTLLIFLTLTSSAIAQEGHPMNGSWVGDWGPNETQRNRVVIEMKWTGKELAGTINPGANAIPMKIARVNPSDWSLHVEADAKDAQGRPITYIIDGKIVNLGAYNRAIVGTWNSGTTKGDFKITRQ
jgi:hypothetical protein